MALAMTVRSIGHALASSLILVLSSGASAPHAADGPRGVAAYRVVGDGIPEPLSPMPGNAQRGRSLIVAREAANCVLCHAVPETSLRFAGDVGPSLEGVSRRLSTAQLRLRVVDYARVSPGSAMPSYHRVEGLVNVASRYRDAPILTASEVEDVVAYLATLR